MSLNIKDYIIAGLIVIIVGMGISLSYYEIRNDILAEQLTNVELLQKEAERKTKIIKRRFEQERIESDEQYKNKLDTLNADIKWLRDSNTSLLPTITKATRDIKTITFQREELDKAIQNYRTDIQRLIAEGRECQIALETIQDWWYNIETLYE